MGIVGRLTATFGIRGLARNLYLNGVRNVARLCGTSHGVISLRIVTIARRTCCLVKGLFWPDAVVDFNRLNILTRAIAA